MNISSTILYALGGMSPHEREDLYLALACSASNRGDEHEADQWLAHAEARTTWQQLKEN